MKRQELNNYLNKYNKSLNDAEINNSKIIFLHNDLWSFDSKDHSFVIDLKTQENLIWSYAYGCYLNNKLPIVYGVSFFQIGRLEQLRKFFGFNNAPILIFNAGIYGYSKYHWSHEFRQNDDVKIMKSLGFKIIDENTNMNLNDLINEYIMQPKNIYIRLSKD